MGLAERRNQADSTKIIILVQNLLLVTGLNRGWSSVKRARHTDCEKGYYYHVCHFDGDGHDDHGTRDGPDGDDDRGTNDKHGGHVEHGINPHIWLDPFNVQIMLLVIADHLGKADPVNAKNY